MRILRLQSITLVVSYHALDHRTSCGAPKLTISYHPFDFTLSPSNIGWEWKTPSCMVCNFTSLPHSLYIYNYFSSRTSYLRFWTINKIGSTFNLIRFCENLDALALCVEQSEWVVCDTIYSMYHWLHQWLQFRWHPLCIIYYTDGFQSHKENSMAPSIISLLELAENPIATGPILF
jgi:hypothetical protein